MHSIIQGGLIRDRQSVFFTAVNPMYVNQNLEKYDLDKPRIAVYKKYVENSTKYNFLVQSEARTKKMIAVPPNSIKYNRSF